MTLTMADGPPASLPAGMDAYAGYVNPSGIGVTWPEVEAIAAAQHAVAFSITTDGSPAQCADVESGAMASWTGYRYGYCSVANVNDLVARYGRPDRLWTAHYGIGRHLCSPLCWPDLVTTADGTQWTDHGGLFDESVLAPDFFELAPAPLPVPSLEDDMDNLTFIRWVYWAFLFRPVDAGGFASWNNWLAAGGAREQMIAFVQESPEGVAAAAALKAALPH